MKSDDWVSQGEKVLIDKPAYHFTLEEFRRGDADQMVFLHLKIWKWSPQVFKEILRNWKLFRQCIHCPVYGVAGEGADPTTWEHFVSRLGFEFHSDVVCENGAVRRLFVHYLKKKKTNERFVYPNPKHEYERERHDGLYDKPVVSSATISDAGV